jgi:hypothetical protein
MSDMPRYWFSTPRFGFGYRRPVTWEGWAVDLTVFAMFALAGLWIHGHQKEHPMLQLGFFLGVLATALVVRHRKGEPKSWG